MQLLCRLLPALALLAIPARAYAATINAANCSEAVVQAAIGSASAGDTVQVPAGNCAWASLNVNKAVHLKGAGKTVTNITLTGENNFTKQSAGIMRISGFSFSKTGGSNSSYALIVGGAWQNTEPIIFENNAFTISNTGFFFVTVAGGLIIANNTINAGWDDSFLRIKSLTGAGWNNADTMGNRDTSGKLNIYIDGNTWFGGTNQAIDCDDESRCVYRYNTAKYSSFNTHGRDTSPLGVRHWEVYNNDFIYLGENIPLANQNWAVWIRGATGVIFNNKIDDITGTNWGEKTELIFSLRGAEDNRPQGSCANVSYPVPAQIGQNHNGTNFFTDPIYIWGNTGTAPPKANFASAGWNWGNPCGFDFNDFFQWGRDGIKSGAAKPGYVPYVYPHPLVTAAGPGDTQAPTVPGTPTASVVSSTQINLTWGGSTDNVAVTGYLVERCQGAGCVNFAQVASPSSPSHNDTVLSPSTLYRYRVRATDAAGNLSGYSGIAAATTQSGGGAVFPPLPSGNTGIAASYPNDTGIAGDANVLFADGFETYTTLSQLTGSGNWNNFFQAGNLALDTSVFFSGAKALRERMPQTASDVSNAVIKVITPDVDEIFVRTYFRHSPTFGGVSSGHDTIRISANYAGPGVRPTGSDFFLVGIENSNYRGEAQPGYTNAYMYFPEQNDLFGEHWYPSGFTSNGNGPDGGFGSGFVARPDVVPTRGTWIAREIYVKANTPGIRDGRVAIWDNGVLVADWQNIRFRDVGTVKIDEIQFENGGQASTQINDKWYDNIVVAKSYIGPMTTGDITPPSVPTDVKATPVP